MECIKLPNEYADRKGAQLKNPVQKESAKIQMCGEIDTIARIY